MSWNVELTADRNPMIHPLQRCSHGEHNAKIHSVKSENDNGKMYQGEPMTAITLKVVGGDSDRHSDGLYLPESGRALDENHQESAFRYRKVCRTQRSLDNSIIGALVRVDVQRIRKNAEFNRISYLHMGSSTEATKYGPQRPSLLASAADEKFNSAMCLETEGM